MKEIQGAKRVLIGCFVIIWNIIGIAALSGQMDFESGAQALEKGDLAAAISTFETIEKGGVVSSELYANLGKAHFLNGDRGRAMLAYERALKLSPGNTEILTSIASVRQELDVRLTDVPDFILVTGQRGLVRALSPTSWVILQILVGLVGLGCLYLLWFRPAFPVTPKILKITMIVSALVFLLSFLFSHQAKTYRHSQDTAIVMVEASSINQAPDDLSPEITEVGEGVKVWITDELSDWYKVILRDKDEGWIKKSEVEVI